MWTRGSTIEMMHKDVSQSGRFPGARVRRRPLRRFTAGARGVAGYVREIRKSLLLKSFRLRIVHMVMGEREN